VVVTRLVISFFVPGRPVTQGSKNVFRGRVVESSKGLPAWRTAVAWEARRVRNTLDQWPLRGPLALSCMFFFARPKKPANPYPPPDLDKLVRAIGDACKVGNLIADDKQFVILDACKGYVTDKQPKPGVMVRIRLNP
jgi:crossover junction endodeoxyribonuclease RusA